jgi:hypothetical protein
MLLKHREVRLESAHKLKRYANLSFAEKTVALETEEMPSVRIVETLIAHKCSRSGDEVLLGYKENASFRASVGTQNVRGSISESPIPVPGLRLPRITEPEVWVVRICVIKDQILDLLWERHQTERSFVCETEACN